ncbi:hypothetical protein BH09BAC1_BH09BAC1_10210 [soil metagenome]
MTPVKISLLSIYMFIVFFLLLASLYDMARGLLHPEMYYYTTISAHAPGTSAWYLSLLKPNMVVIVFCMPKLFFLKKFSEVGEDSSIWNPVFYFAFAIVVAAGFLALIEIFDTPNIEIIQNV